MPTHANLLLFYHDRLFMCYSFMLGSGWRDIWLPRATSAPGTMTDITMTGISLWRLC